VDKSLIQTVVKLTSPGVPDLYNGSELWDLSMVDPDNRRPVDYTLRAKLLERLDQRLHADRGQTMRELRRDWHDGAIKLATVATLLRHRQQYQPLYADGDYQALPATGQRADDLCAYARNRNGDKLLVAAVRRGFAGQALKDWEDTRLPIPEGFRRTAWRELLTGRGISLQAEMLHPAELFEELPVVVLTSQAR
jgi:(1->4)-alpha-D-glucan 1-alpha-D-glucosylmutase